MQACRILVILNFMFAFQLFSQSIVIGLKKLTRVRISDLKSIIM